MRGAGVAGIYSARVRTVPVPGCPGDLQSPAGNRFVPQAPRITAHDGNTATHRRCPVTFRSRLRPGSIDNQDRITSRAQVKHLFTNYLYVRETLFCNKNWYVFVSEKSARDDKILYRELHPKRTLPAAGPPSPFPASGWSGSPGPRGPLNNSLESCRARPSLYQYPIWSVSQ